MGVKQRITGINSLLTVANGVNPVTLYTTGAFPASEGGFDALTVLVNGAYAGGPNNSFKVNGAAGSFLEIYVEVQTPNEGVWRRLTPSDGRYRIRTTDTHDFIVLSDIAAYTIFRIMAVLELPPTATINLDWGLLFQLNDVRSV